MSTHAAVVVAAQKVVEESARLLDVPMSLVNAIYDLETALLDIDGSEVQP